MVQVNISVSKEEREKIDVYGGPRKFVNKAFHCLEQLDPALQISEDVKVKDFLFSTEATNQEIYAYLKDHPESAEYLYQKYSANSGFIKDLCNPKNPIYLPKADEYLKDVITVETVEKDLITLQTRQTKLQHEIGLLEEELEQSKMENNKELSDLKNNISLKTYELSDLQSKLQILSSVESMKLLSDVFRIMNKIFKGVDDQVPTFSTNYGWNRDSALVSTDLLQTVKNNLDKLKQLMDSDSLVPQELLDKLQSELDGKKEELLMQITYAVDHNIPRLHRKVLDDIMAVLRQVEGKEEIRGSSVNAIVDYLSTAVKRLNAWDEDLPGVLGVLKQDVRPENGSL